MIPNGQEIIFDGHKVVFESTTYQCRGCFFENRDSCPDCDEGIWVEEGSPWHTGVPTENGYYLVHMTIYDEEYDLCVDFKDGIWDDRKWGFGYNYKILAWMPIEPYKEAST